MERSLSDGGDGVPVRAVVGNHEVPKKGVEDLRESNESIHVMRPHTDPGLSYWAVEKYHAVG